MRVLAVDIGGSHISCGAVDERRLLQTVSIETDSQERLSCLLPNLAEILKKISGQNGNNFDGIGVGFCGLVDSAAGRIVSTNHKYVDATDINLVEWASRELQLPLVLENDARLALLGEHHAGAARAVNDVVMITLGTGIGTAAMMDGRLVRGKHFQAGCLGGHFTIVAGGRLCSCGARGCFEAEASTYALADVVRSWPGVSDSPLATEPSIDFETLFYWADRDDKVAGEVRLRSLNIWAACALSLVHAYDPELLVIGGGVMKSSHPILEVVQQHVDSYAWTPWGRVQIRRAELGSDAALFGAMALFQDRS